MYICTCALKKFKISYFAMQIIGTFYVKKKMFRYLLQHYMQENIENVI